MPAVDARIYQSGYSGLTYTSIQSFLKRTFTSAEQTLVASLIVDAEIMLCELTNRQFKYTSQEYYETLNGGFLKFMPFATPVSTLAGVTIDGVDVTDNYTLNTDYFVYDNYIVFESPLVSATDNRNAVKLTYTLRQFWGKDVENLLKKWVSLEFLSSENGGAKVDRFNFGNLSQDINHEALQKELDKLVFRYTDFEI